MQPCGDSGWATVVGRWARLGVVHLWAWRLHGHVPRVQQRLVAHCRDAAVWLWVGRKQHGGTHAL